MKRLRGKELLRLGFEQGPAVGLALEVVKKHYKFKSREEIIRDLEAIAADPKAYQKDRVWAKVAALLIPETKPMRKVKALNPNPINYRVYGIEHIDKEALEQMDIALRLPVARGGALMPDAHYGYGLPIGGVLATENAIIPYGVGMDIGCRMCLSVYDIPAERLERDKDKLVKALHKHTRFGFDTFEKPMNDPIFSRSEFKEIKKVKELKGKALSQIGSSGSGNHFVEFGWVDITEPDDHLGLAVGRYLAILSHSGSRGLGANIAQYYTKIAREKCLLPKEAQQLAWLDLDSEAGQEYWLAMNLAGDYASACHHHIHHRLGKFLAEAPLVRVENHHNFAWKELIDGRELIIHRKGATPAAENELGIIPGSMTAPAFIVKGKGKEDALNSASHGAGRQMSRRKAKNTLSKSELKKQLDRAGVELIGGGLDEAPFAYKDIFQVMHHQQDLVEVLGTFQPQIVRMDGQ